MINRYGRLKCLQYQRGIASLVISLVLLVSITFIVLYTSRSLLMESKVSTNEYRGGMAFEAAEKGVESAIVAVHESWAYKLDPATGEFLRTDGEYVLMDTRDGDQFVFDVDGDGSVAGNTNTFTLNNGSDVTLVMTGRYSSNDEIRFDIESTGRSDDKSATRVIHQTLVVIPPVPNTPDTPLLSRSSIVIGGSATVVNPEGHSTIWSGENVNIGSNNATSTEIADPTDPNYPNCLGGSVQCGTTASSDPNVLGLDIIGNDSSLANLSAEEFFYNFLGDYPANYKATRTDVVTTNLPALDGQADGQIIWQDGDIAMQAGNTFGSMTAPALVIVDGDLTVAGNNFFFGLLYVTGSIFGTGNLTVTGAVVVNGVGTSGGGVNVTYNSQVLDLLNMMGGRPAGSAGSWRDFEF